MATLGQQLKAAREAKGVSESEAGRATKILTKLIVGMEADDFSEMPAPTYAKGFIRLYATYLGLDPEPLVAEYVKKNNTQRKPLISEESQLDRNTHPASAPLDLKGLPAGLNPLRWFSELGAGLSTAWQKLPAGPFKDIRVVSATAAGLFILIILAVSISNCSRRRAAEQPRTPAAEAAPARMLLDEPVPDLYLVEPGKIEQ